MLMYDICVSMFRHWNTEGVTFYTVGVQEVSKLYIVQSNQITV